MRLRVPTVSRAALTGDAASWWGEGGARAPEMGGEDVNRAAGLIPKVTDCFHARFH